PECSRRTPCRCGDGHNGEAALGSGGHISGTAEYHFQRHHFLGHDLLSLLWRWAIRRQLRQLWWPHFRFRSYTSNTPTSTPTASNTTPPTITNSSASLIADVREAAAVAAVHLMMVCLGEIAPRYRDQSDRWGSRRSRMALSKRTQAKRAHRNVDSERFRCRK